MLCKIFLIGTKHAGDAFYGLNSYCKFVIEKRIAAVISYEFGLWINPGQQWNATLLVLKQELLRRWPNAEIEIGKYGMTVKAGNT